MDKRKQPQTEEHKKKISLSKIGKSRAIFSESHRKNISLSHLGKKHSDDTKKKMSKSTLGSNHPNWRGGITPVRKIQRHSLEYKYWHKSCLSRDNFTCQKSGQNGGKLIVHHINNFSEYPELRFDINNGITLSEKSHKEFHDKYGYKNNTEQQLVEFLTTNK